MGDIFEDIELNINEENSLLKNKSYDIPEEVLDVLKGNLKKYSEHKTVKGYKRANHLINNPNQPFPNLVMIKHYFDNIDKDNINKIEYELNGGDTMNKWVQNLIKTERERVKSTKVARTNSGMKGQFRDDVKDKDFDTGLADTKRIMSTPDIMTNSALLEDINKIKNLINKTK